MDESFAWGYCFEVVDCIAKVQPKLPDKTLVNGEVGVEYFDSLTASAINYKNDDDFNYYFDFIGRPPNGINYFIEHRRIYFSGVPTEKGVFSFSAECDKCDGYRLKLTKKCFPSCRASYSEKQALMGHR